jgi:benzoyl-CoA reductase/2-hydroxyglutaryl-CoA dehydratase subunit BcrC/BadD/HgdB
MSAFPKIWTTEQADLESDLRSTCSCQEIFRLGDAAMRQIPEIPRRMEVIGKFKSSGGAVAAVLPIHYSRGLLRSFGILPVEVWGPPKVDVSYGGAHLQPYVCSIVHNALSFLKTGGLDVVDFIIVPHACDSLQGLGSILLDFVKPKQPVFPLYLPRGKRKEDIEFLANEYKSMYEWLVELTGKKPSYEEMLASIRREEAADALLAELHERRRYLDLTNLEFYRLVRSREFLPAEDFVDIASKVLESASGEEKSGIPVLISGIVPEPMEVLEILEELGGVAVADDMACCGRRLYGAGNSDDPFVRAAERVVFGPPDPTRGSPIEERLEHLVSLARKRGAKGVIFYDIKFCEPELFDLPDLRKGLKDAGLPSVAIEVDINDELPHQTITRLGAFLEVIE